jgi:hypothetical protein
VQCRLHGRWAQTGANRIGAPPDARSPLADDLVSRSRDAGLRCTVGIALAVALTAFVAAHLALVAGLARRKAWWRAATALFVAPLAPWWGYRSGMRLRSLAWAAALVLYAMGVAMA